MAYAGTSKRAPVAHGSPVGRDRAGHEGPAGAAEEGKALPGLAERAGGEVGDQGHVDAARDRWRAYGHRIGMARGHPHRPRRNVPNTSAWRGWRAIGRSSASRQPRSRSCPRSIPAGRARRGNAGVRPRRGTPGMGRLGIATKPGLADVERGMEGAGRAIVARGRNDCPRRPAQATQPESGCSSSRRASLPSSSSHSRPSGACTTARMRSPMS